MKKFVVVFLSAMVFAGTEARLDKPAAADLTSDTLTATASKRVLERDMESTPVSTSWLLDSQATLTMDNKAPTAQSKELWLEVGGDAFNAGIALNIDKAGSMVRISPVSPDAVVPSLNDLVLVNEKGVNFENGRGMKMFLDPMNKDVAKQTMFSEGTAVFRLDEKLGRGEVLLYADHMNYDANARYMVHVRENDSDVSLTAVTDQLTYLAGQELTVDAAMVAGDQALDLTSVTGEIVSPLGRRFPLTFHQGQASWHVIDGAEHPGLGLWEVQIHASANHDGKLVRRDLNTAFGVCEVTARFTGSLTLDHNAAELSAELGVEVGVPGRYEIRAILFGTNAEGHLVPFAVGNSAAVLEVGVSSLSLSYDAQLLEKSGLKAPFAVKDLRLLHQNRMSLLHQQEQAFTFSY